MLIQNKETKEIHIANKYPICGDFVFWNKESWQIVTGPAKSVCKVCQNIRRYGKIILTFNQEPTFITNNVDLLSVTKQFGNRWEVLLTGKHLEAELSRFIEELNEQLSICTIT